MGIRSGISRLYRIAEKPGQIKNDLAYDYDTVKRTLKGKSQRTTVEWAIHNANQKRKALYKKGYRKLKRKRRR